MWPFKKKAPPPRDCRNWNEDWQVGDTAEVVATTWVDDIPPWERLPLGARYTVTGFSDSTGHYKPHNRHYFLRLQGLAAGYSTTCFRKVRTVKTEESEVVQRILKAKPGKDKVREDAE